MIDFNLQFLIACIINIPAKINPRIEFVNAVKSGIRKNCSIIKMKIYLYALLAIMK